MKFTALADEFPVSYTKHLIFMGFRFLCGTTFKPANWICDSAFQLISRRDAQPYENLENLLLSNFAAELFLRMDKGKGDEVRYVVSI